MTKYLFSRWFSVGFCFIVSTGFCQQTDTVKTFKFSDAKRVGNFTFPSDTTISYSKIKMLYRMRCKNAQVSTSANRNLGCGEWDYSCNTYLTDSSKIDSLKATHPDHKISRFTGSSFPFKQLPTKTFTEYIQKNTEVQSTANESVKLSYIISDFQQSGFNMAKLKGDSTVSCQLIRLEGNKTPNVYIDSCWFANPARQFNQAELLFVKIVN